MKPKRTAAAIIPTAGLALLLAACGAGSPTTAATTQNGLVAYAHCMRTHGLPTFPDPTSSEGIPKDKIPVGSPRFPVASSACKHVMPLTGLGPQETTQQMHSRLAGALEFARCIRSHGFPTFPDPTRSGQLTHEMLANAGINLHLPAVVQAADACVSVTHGLITRASVASFVAKH
jgi:hypothetical protein